MLTEVAAKELLEAGTTRFLWEGPEADRVIGQMRFDTRTLPAVHRSYKVSNIFEHVARVEYATHNPEIIIAGLNPIGNRLPGAQEFSSLLENDLGRLSEENPFNIPIPQLVTDYNVIGINFMNGKPVRPARIKQHFDSPNEVGVIAVVGVEGMGDDTTLSPGEVALYACMNLCTALGVDPTPHGASTHQQRVSYTFTQRLDLTG